MGYSISTRFSSSEERERMRLFLVENEDLLKQMDPYAYVPSIGEDLAYAPKVTHLLGFHGSQVTTMWDLVAWMTVQSTYRDPKRGMFFYYDDEAMTVRFDAHPQDTQVDDRGIRVLPPKDIFRNALEALLGDLRPNTKGILETLHQRWLVYQAAPTPETPV